jgi:hypothetical protein
VTSNLSPRLSVSPESMLVTARYSARYIDKIFAEKDLPIIYQTIEVISQTRQLPEEFWLFCRIYEWAPSRSGVWQYYESLQDPTFEGVSAALERYGLHAVAQRYRSGKDAWQDEDKMRALDSWLDANAAGIHASVFALIQSQTDLLK